MNKKGFTLVELLAVIAILAILVIMALPAVLRMFNNARRDSFTNEVNTVIRTARQQYLLSGGSDTTWSNAEGSSKTLDLTGNSNLKYYVKMNNEGKITKLQVSNGDFQYNKRGIIDVAESSDVEAVSDLEEDEVIIINSNGTSIQTIEKYSFANISHIAIATPLSNEIMLYNTYQEAIEEFGHNFVMKYTLANNIWCIVENGYEESGFCSFEAESECNNDLQYYGNQESYTCVRKDNAVDDEKMMFLLNGNPYFLTPDNSLAYESNKEILLGAFGSENCREDDNIIACAQNNFKVSAYRNGKIVMSDDDYQCTSYGFYSCAEQYDSPAQ